jgi:hypothetical protein
MAITILLFGCTTLPDGNRWGDDVTLLPSRDRVGHALQNAFLSPETWVPAAGALAFQVGDLDESLSQWAMRNTPVYGSQDTASQAGHVIRVTSEVLWLASVLATPGGDQPLHWTIAKLKGGAVQYYGAVGLTRRTTEYLKKQVGRTRPTEENDRSFPSSNATRTSSLLTLASRNVEAIPCLGSEKPILQASFGALAVASAWSRLEAGAHYPSDVLAGLALGHFLSVFVNDAFVGRYDRLSLQVNPVEGLAISVGWIFKCPESYIS